MDGVTAERFDLAILAARAFDLRAGQNYLALSGVDSSLVQRFADRYPGELRATIPLNRIERRRRSETDS
jgi:hypothetical protein